MSINGLTGPITIYVNTVGNSISGRNIGSGTGVYVFHESGTGIFRSLSGDGGTIITQSGSGISISSQIYSISGRNIGNGTGIFVTTESNTGVFRSLSGDGGVVITQSGSGISISSYSISSRNIGTGTNIFVHNESGTGVFRSISGEGGVTINQSGSGISISSQNNTSANLSNIFVPFTGASLNVDLGTKSLSTSGNILVNNLKLLGVLSGDSNTVALDITDNATDYQIIIGDVNSTTLSSVSRQFEIRYPSSLIQIRNNDESDHYIYSNVDGIVSENPRIKFDINGIEQALIDVNGVNISNQLIVGSLATVQRIAFNTLTVTSGITTLSSAGVLFTSGSVTARLPSHTAGAQYIVKTIGTGTTTLSASIGLIDNSITQIITNPFVSINVISNGTNWYIV